MIGNNPILQQALDQLGGRVGQDLSQNFFFMYGANFTNIAQNATQAQPIRINAGMDFVCQAFLLSANFNSANTPTGMPPQAKLARHVNFAMPAAAPLSQYAHLGQVLVQVGTNNRQYQNTPMRADLCTCDFGEIVLLPTFIYISAMDSVNVQLTNNVPALTGAATPGIDAQFALLGMNCQRTN